MNQPRRRLYLSVLIVLVLGITATYYVFGSSLREVHASGVFERRERPLSRGRRPNPRSKRRQDRPGHPAGRQREDRLSL